MTLYYKHQSLNWKLKRKSVFIQNAKVQYLAQNLYNKILFFVKLLHFLIKILLIYIVIL